MNLARRSSQTSRCMLRGPACGHREGRASEVQNPLHGGVNRDDRSDFAGQLLSLDQGVGTGDGAAAGALEVEGAAVLLRVAVPPAEGLPAPAHEPPSAPPSCSTPRTGSAAAARSPPRASRMRAVIRRRHQRVRDRRWPPPPPLRTPWRLRRRLNRRRRCCGASCSRRSTCRA